MNNRVFKKLAKYLVVIFAFLLLPQALNIQSELNMRTIISAIAVDVVDDEFLVTAQVVKPSSSVEGGGTELDFISASATTVAQAMDEVTIALGRTAGLAHIGTIIIGKEVAEKEKLMSTLDYFLREKGIQNSAMLLISEDKAKDTLENTKKLQLSSAVGLPKVFLYKQNNTNGVMMQLQNFLNDNMAVSRSSVISGVEILSKDEAEKQEGNSQGGSGGQVGSSGGESSGGSSGGSGGSSSGSASETSSGDSGSEKDGRIKYANNIYVFKDGKLKVELKDENAINGVYLINRNSREGVVSVGGINNEFMKDAKVSVYFRDKKVKIKTSWESGVPKCTFIIKTNRNEVYAIESENLNGNLYETDKLYLTDDVVLAVKDKIESDILTAYRICQAEGVDIYQCANRIYQRNPNKWKQFLSQYGETDYIKHVEVDVVVEMKKQI